MLVAKIRQSSQKVTCHEKTIVSWARVKDISNDSVGTCTTQYGYVLVLYAA